MGGMANVGVFPYDASTPVGIVRALIGDTDPVEVIPPTDPRTGIYAVYSDADIQGMLAAFNNSVKRSAAHAIRMMGVEQALKLKKFRTDDLTVDGAAIAEALRRAAKDLDDSADTDDNAAVADIFGIVYPFDNRCSRDELAEGTRCCGVC